jgi:hypothetical protein
MRNEDLLATGSRRHARLCSEHSPSLQPTELCQHNNSQGNQSICFGLCLVLLSRLELKSWPSQVIITSPDRVAVPSLSRLVEPTRQAGRFMPLFFFLRNLDCPRVQEELHMRAKTSRLRDECCSASAQSSFYAMMCAALGWVMCAEKRQKWPPSDQVSVPLGIFSFLSSHSGVAKLILCLSWQRPVIRW